VSRSSQPSTGRRQEGVNDVKRKVLGRGLEALISQDLRESVAETERVKELDIDRIEANPHQPRGRFDEGQLKQLAASIEKHGILQPVVVRRHGDKYQLIMGERRLRAARIAGKRSVPAIVREAGDADSLKFALMENLQREDLNPIEEAKGYNELKEVFDLSIREIANLLGKDRSTVSNTMRLLALPESVQEMLAAGDLSAGHARALLAIEGEREQIAWAERVVSEGITVREIELTHRPKQRKTRRRGRRKSDPQVRATEDLLEKHLGTRVQVTPRRKGGVVSIEYYTNEDLERILERMGIVFTP
jgi:ParB family chromosome partitioning protein